MKQSIYNGRTIYANIQAKQKELEEIYKGLQLLSEKLEPESLPYILLHKQKEEKAKELQELFETKYTLTSGVKEGASPDLYNFSSTPQAPQQQEQPLESLGTTSSRYPRKTLSASNSDMFFEN